MNINDLEAILDQTDKIRWQVKQLEGLVDALERVGWVHVSNELAVVARQIELPMAEIIKLSKEFYFKQPQQSEVPHSNKPESFSPGFQPPGSTPRFIDL